MLINTKEQDQHFLALAYEYARDYSPDPRTQNGAVIVNPESMEIIGKGANRFPNGVKELPERLEPAYKKSYLEHAERDAIFSAIRQGNNPKGCTMYVPWFACSDCAKAIIGAGIVKVVGHLAPCSASTAWSDTIAIGLRMFEEAGIQYSYYDGVIGVKDLRFNGEIVER
ncbi:MAG TPA: deaminase [Gammaproteobacteria bacterium]|nr:deaminase [Gammaproteobacteria bacterium]